MTTDEFYETYSDSLEHGWVTSKIAAIAAKQKERERQYNKWYYQLHSDKWKKKMLIAPEIPSDKKITNASEAEQATREAKRNAIRFAQLQGASQQKLAKALLSKSDSPMLNDSIKRLSARDKIRLVKQLISGNVDMVAEGFRRNIRKGSKTVSNLLKGLMR